MSNTIEAAHEVLKESPVYSAATEDQQEEMAQSYIRDLDSSGADIEEMLNREDRK